MTYNSLVAPPFLHPHERMILPILHPTLDKPSSSKRIKPLNINPMPPNLTQILPLYYLLVIGSVSDGVSLHGVICVALWGFRAGGKDVEEV